VVGSGIGGRGLGLGLGLVLGLETGFVSSRLLFAAKKPQSYVSGTAQLLSRHQSGSVKQVSHESLPSAIRFRPRHLTVRIVAERDPAFVVSYWSKIKLAASPRPRFVRRNYEP
jgi:hypothetical protein